MKSLKLIKTDKPVVCVLSGGMDSTVLVYALVLIMDKDIQLNSKRLKLQSLN